MRKKKCLQCLKVYSKPLYSNAKWLTSKYCSKACTNNSFKRDDVYKRCLFCKNEFKKPRKYRLTEDAWKKRKFCSRKCMGDHRNKKITKVCINCQVEYFCKYAERDRSTTCSRSCADIKRRRRVLMSCLNCKKIFEDKLSNIERGNGKFCSRICMSKNLSKRYMGKNGPGWKGGVSLIHERIRASSQYKKWRKSVLLRDDYKCVMCGKSDIVMNVDHIKPFAVYPDLRFEEDNGRTLCIPCHKNTDTYGVNKRFASLSS